jgi:hypothetical protein
MDIRLTLTVKTVRQTAHESHKEDRKELERSGTGGLELRPSSQRESKILILHLENFSVSMNDRRVFAACRFLFVGSLLGVLLLEGGLISGWGGHRRKLGLALQNPQVTPRFIEDV